MLPLMALNTAIILTGIIYRFYQLDTIPAFGGDEAKLICEMDEPGIGWTIHIHYIGFYLEAVTNPFLMLFGFNGYGARLSPACAGTATVFACTIWAILHRHQQSANPQAYDKDLRTLFVFTTAACAASLPLLFVYSRILFPHAFFPVLSISALILLERSLHGPPYLFVLSGLLLGIAFGFHPMPILSLPAFMGVYLWANRKSFRLWPYLAFLATFVVPALPTIGNVFNESSEWPSSQPLLEYIKSAWAITVGQQTYVYINGTGFTESEILLVSILLALSLAGAAIYWRRHRSDISEVGHLWIITAGLIVLYLMTLKRPLSNDGYERYAIGILSFLPLALGKSVLAGVRRQGIAFACVLLLLNLLFTWGNIGRFITSLEGVGGQSYTYFRTGGNHDPREDFFKTIAEETEDCDIVTWEWNAYWAFKYYCRKYQKNYSVSMGYPKAWESLRMSKNSHRYVVLDADSPKIRLSADTLVTDFFQGSKLARYPLVQANGEVYLHIYRIQTE